MKNEEEINEEVAEFDMSVSESVFDLKTIEIVKKGLNAINNIKDSVFKDQ